MFFNAFRMCSNLTAVCFLILSSANAQKPAELQETLRVAVASVRDAVVVVRILEPHRTPTSGVVIDSKGLILTHGHHDQRPGTKVEIKFVDGSVENATIVSVIDTTGGPDLSLLQLEPGGEWPSVGIAETLPEINAPCFHLGYPAISGRETSSKSPLLRVGQVLEIDRASIYADPPVIMGDSGGPLFDLSGQLIGIANAMSSKGTSCWASPIELLTKQTLLQPLGGDRDDYLRRKDRIAAVRREHRGLPELVPLTKLAKAKRSTVRLSVDGKEIADGTIVRTNGLIVSKRSLFVLSNGDPRGRVSCKFFDGGTEGCRIEREFPDHDLVLLRCVRSDLTAVEWADENTIRQSQLVVAPLFGSSQTRGVISSDEIFSVDAMGGSVGVFAVKASPGGVMIQVQEALRKKEENPLEWYSYSDGRLRHGQTIASVNGSPTTTSEQYTELTKELVAGDLVRLVVVKPDGGSIEMVVTAGPGYWKALDSWGPISRRRTGFVTVFAHDCPIPADHVGGPVVNSDGAIMGINIARFHNYQSLAVPSNVVRMLLTNVDQK